jgi:hypothetical protein
LRWYMRRVRCQQDGGDPIEVTQPELPVEGRRPPG